jgi:hypothetical protein
LQVSPRLTMCSLKRFLVSSCVALGAISISEIAYTLFTLFKYWQQFSTSGFLLTGFVNVGLVFFGVSLIVGALQLDVALLAVSLTYFTIELGRSAFSLFGTWTEKHDDGIERAFVTFDAGDKLFKNILSVKKKIKFMVIVLVIILAILTCVSSLIIVMKVEDKETNISFIGKSIAMNREEAANGHT